jgi:hypothetical protein
MTDRIRREIPAIARTEAQRAKSYLKLGFGGEHTESNQRLMYTSAWASPQ